LLNNSKLGDYVIRIYAIEPKIKPYTDIFRSASDLVLQLKFTRGG